MTHTQPQSPDGWPQPYGLPDAEPYWEGLAAGEIRYQHCTACSQPVWPAHSFCPHCGGGRPEWRVSKGRGAIYSFSTVVRGPTPAFASIAPYTVGFIEMEEGYFLFAQIEGTDEALRIGADVEAKLIQRGDQKLPVFVVT
jgi:uncharacterized OB-fold protein